MAIYHSLFIFLHFYYEMTIILLYFSNHFVMLVHIIFLWYLPILIKRSESKILTKPHIINFNIIRKTAPGNPKIPTKIEVPIFSPIWNWNATPTKLIIYIKTPPKIELITSFNIFFNGNIKILPTKNNIIIQAKKVMIVSVPKFNHPTFISLLWLNLDKYY